LCRSWPFPWRLAAGLAAGGANRQPDRACSSSAATTQIIGNALATDAARRLAGDFHLPAFPKHDLVIRNSASRGRVEDTHALENFGSPTTGSSGTADVVFAFFGSTNPSPATTAAGFQEELEGFIKHTLAKVQRQESARLVAVLAITHENTKA